jgi:hypothetical protein
VDFHFWASGYAKDCMCESTAGPGEIAAIVLDSHLAGLPWSMKTIKRSHNLAPGGSQALAEVILSDITPELQKDLEEVSIGIRG